MGTLDSLREATGHHYLEDIFVHHVTEAEGLEGAAIGLAGELEVPGNPEATS